MNNSMKLLSVLCLVSGFGVVACSPTARPSGPAQDSGTTEDTPTPPTDNATPTDNGTPPADVMSSPLCTTYCTQIMTNCRAANAQYNSMEECTAYCNSARWNAGTAGEQSGNTLQCRIYHGGAPAMMDPVTHCPHAGPTGDGVCGDVLNFRTDAPTAYRRVDRMGMPAVSTALVPSAQKEAFNNADPAGDMSFAGAFVSSLGGLHMALDDDLQMAGLTACSMTTMVNGLPECVGQNYAAGATVASLILPNDVIAINPTADAGFPNGRRLPDPVIDVTLSVLLLRIGQPCGAMPCSATTLATGLGARRSLNPAANDLPFLMEFPYLALPHQPR